MFNFFKYIWSLLFLSISVLAQQIPSSAYNPGPDVTDPMELELLQILADIPPMGVGSELIAGEQIFRPIFGPVPLKTLLGKNAVQIWNQGQDATHIAEGSNAPATAGYGGRVQDLNAYLGVLLQAAFTNCYPFTIQKQYGTFGTPFVHQKSDGSFEMRISQFVDNGLWNVSQSQDSPLTVWRNRLIDWMLRRNPDSLKLIMLFGKASSDAIASFVISRGGHVDARYSTEDLKKIRVPVVKAVPAGSNKTFPVLIDAEGNDIYQKMLGRLDYKNVRDQAKVERLLKDESRFQELLSQMVFTNGGTHGSGIIDPAQLGGYDLDTMRVSPDAPQSISLKGLKLSDGSVINHDIIVRNFPHPTVLSMKTKEEASKAIADALKPAKPFVDKGWKINPEPGMRNQFSEGQPYVYGRSDLPPGHYAFGTPGIRMTSKSDGGRMGRDVVVIGSRDADEKSFPKEIVESIRSGKPAEALDPEEFFTSVPRLSPRREQFDPGPGQEYARLLKDFDLAEIFKPKTRSDGSEMAFSEEVEHGEKIVDGINAYHVKVHPKVGDFAHYRGTFKSPKVVFLADPDSYDDIRTNRALTGERGQYIQGLMRDLNVGDQYLIVKTVPFGMDGATDEDWDYVLRATSRAREGVLRKLLEENQPDVLVADGPRAAAELKRILNTLGKTNVVVEMSRGNVGHKKDVLDAGGKIAQVLKADASKITGTRGNIPRSHLTFGAKNWEGTSGDSVAPSQGPDRGLSFIVAVPKWASRQVPSMSMGQAYQALTDKLIALYDALNLPRPKEAIGDFLKRLNLNGRIHEVESPEVSVVQQVPNIEETSSCASLLLEAGM